MPLTKAESAAKSALVEVVQARVDVSVDALRGDVESGFEHFRVPFQSMIF